MAKKKKKKTKKGSIEVFGKPSISLEPTKYGTGKDIGLGGKS